MLPRHLIAIFLLQLGSLSISGRRKMCSMTREEGETCARTMLVIGDRNRIIPHTPREVFSYCHRIQSATYCLENYGNCVSSFQHSLLKTLARYVRREFKTSVCTETGRIELANNLQCLDKGQLRTETLHQCMDKFVIMTRMVRNGLSESMKDYFPAGCCAFQLFSECVADFAEEYCSFGFSDSVKGYGNNILTKGFKSLQDVCGHKWDSLSRCDDNSPKVMAVFRNATRRNVNPQLETPLFFFLDVMDLP